MGLRDIRTQSVGGMEAEASGLAEEKPTLPRPGLRRQADRCPQEAFRYPPGVRSITDVADPDMGFMIKADGQRFRGAIAHFT
jgi:hypothetical protein